MTDATPTAMTPEERALAICRVYYGARDLSGIRQGIIYTETVKHLHAHAAQAVAERDHEWEVALEGSTGVSSEIVRPVQHAREQWEGCAIAKERAGQPRHDAA